MLAMSPARVIGPQVRPPLVLLKSTAPSGPMVQQSSATIETRSPLVAITWTEP